MEHPDADFNNQKVIFEGMYWNKKNGDLDKLPVSASLNLVIPLGFEPKTHSLEGCCSNPTELRNHHKSGAKVGIFMCTTKFSVKNILISFIFQSFCTNGYKKRKSHRDFLMRCVRDSRSACRFHSEAEKEPWPMRSRSERNGRTKKGSSLETSLCGAYGTRTRDLLRDRQAF